MYSPVYQFEPEGLTFAAPIGITLPYQGSQRLATLFWSRTQATGFDRLGGIPAVSTLSGEVTHFSRGFIADGVDYTDPPDQSCVVSKLVEGRTSVAGSGGAPIASSVALFFAVDDCQGRPCGALR
jgi:hypothetical protein